ATGNKSTNETDGVQLTFKHKLAQVAIHAKNANTAYKYYIKGVKIANVISSGNFNFSPAEDVSEWTYGETPSTDSYSIEYDKAMATPLGIVGTNLMCTVSADESGAEVLDYSVGNAMLIPQQLTAWDITTNTTGSYLAVLAKVETVDGSVVYPAASDTDGFGWLLVPVDTKWDAGNRYVYTLDFTEGAGFDESGEEVLGGPVKFTMEVDEWDEEIIGEVDNLVGTWSLESLVVNTQYLNQETQDESSEYKGDALTTYLTTNNMDDLTQINIVVYADHYQLVVGEETIEFKIAENNSLVPYEGDGTVIYTIEELTNERVIFKQEYDTTQADGVVTGKKISLFTYNRVIDNQ
ncbi:MAG: fimbrillin family protein, partial [Bacteroidales bacterium]|nr:fimbrillin family protein [Bacteroidales bacterium]